MFFCFLVSLELFRLRSNRSCLGCECPELICSLITWCSCKTSVIKFADAFSLGPGVAAWCAPRIFQASWSWGKARLYQESVIELKEQFGTDTCFLYVLAERVCFEGTVCFITTGGLWWREKLSCSKKASWIEPLLVFLPKLFAGCFLYRALHSCLSCFVHVFLSLFLFAHLLEAFNLTDQDRFSFLQLLLSCSWWNFLFFYFRQGRLITRNKQLPVPKAAGQVLSQAAGLYIDVVDRNKKPGLVHPWFVKKLKVYGVYKVCIKFKDI